MDAAYQIGDRVQIRLDSKFGEHEGWYSGEIIRIDAYSEHRSFYWVRLDPQEQGRIKLTEISVFNPRNIRKLQNGE